MDAVTHVGREDITPDDGDLTLCFKCGALYRYVGGIPTLMTISEIDALPYYVKTQLIEAEIIRGITVDK